MFKCDDTLMHFEHVFDPWKHIIQRISFKKKCSLLYKMGLNCIFMKIRFFYHVFLYDLLLSCFENYMDNYQIVIFSANFGTIKK
jgi:hypothetical protein